MNPFINDALLTGVKEGIKIAAIWAIVSSYSEKTGRHGILGGFYAGVSAAASLGIISLFVVPDARIRELLSSLSETILFAFYALSLCVIFFNGLRIRSNGLARFLSFVLTILYFSTDMLGSSMYVRNIYLMQSGRFSVYAGSFLGFFSALFLLAYALRHASAYIARYFDAAQVFVFLLVVKIAIGGTGGFSEFEILNSVQRGAMKFTHDFVHQTFVYLMIPDHPILSTTAWVFVGVLFGPNLGIAVALIVLLGPSIAYIYKINSNVPEAPEGLTTGAERRMFRASYKSSAKRKSLPVLIYIAIVLSAWGMSGGSQTPQLYVPQPRPLIVDKGAVIIPLKDPTMDLSDGALHKFSVNAGGETIRLMVLYRQQGGYAVCLDACEICPPDGYGQSGDNVVCVYCKTPIPVDSLGRPGGCNPVPVDAVVSDADIRIQADALYGKWLELKAGYAKKGISK